ncbi:MAG: UDP-N-acetylmuramate dehydrogenase [Deltaproteobacteria bacterium]
MDEVIKNELKALVENIEFDVPMRTKTSLRVGGPADVVAAPANAVELQRLIRYIREKGLSFFIVGRGTNLLVMDGGIRGTVIDLKGFNTLEVREGCVVYSGAGVPLPKLVYFAMENSLAGIEFAAGIPGSVGGAIVMNAGTTEGEIKDVVESVTLMGVGGDISEIKKEALSFSYRNLNLPKVSIVLGATFKLKAGDKEAIKERIGTLLQARKAKQPLDLPNAGCIFKNPASVSAGRIIDEVGLKGLQFGGARVSELHANFIVNNGKATAKDILSLLDDVMEKVYEKKGIALEPEIKIVGEMENKRLRIKP